LKRDHNLAVLNLVPSDDSLKIRSEYAQHLTVNIVNRGGEEQQGANAPAITAYSRRDGLPYLRPRIFNEIARRHDYELNYSRDRATIIDI
jgi:hypothetical protein